MQYGSGVASPLLIAFQEKPAVLQAQSHSMVEKSVKLEKCIWIKNPRTVCYCVDVSVLIIYLYSDVYIQ